MKLLVTHSVPHYGYVSTANRSQWLLLRRVVLRKKNKDYIDCLKDNVIRQVIHWNFSVEHETLLSLEFNICLIQTLINLQHFIS